MSRYVAVKMAPDGDWNDPLLPHLYVDGPSYKYTGLLNADGHRLYHQQRPIGFGRMNEWND